MTEPGGKVHRDHPFVPSEPGRDPARRLRGRLASPVTVWTAAAGAERAGLTVSSLFVAEGDPGAVLGLVVPTSDLWDALQESGTFVVHVLDDRRRALAERFAGLRPSPGGPFAGLEVDDSAWGPVIADLDTRAFCRLDQTYPTDFHYIVRGAVERIDIHELTRPMVYFRGRFRKLGD